MKALLIDTSTNIIGIGVFDGKKCLHESYTEGEKRYNSAIMGLIDEAMKASGLIIGDIDVFGSTLGPGSFTGIRVGMAAAKGLADGCSAKFFGASTLDILAYSVDDVYTKKAALLDARRNEVYMGIYKKDSAEYELTAKENIDKAVKGACDIYILERDIKLLEGAAVSNKGKTTVIKRINLQSFNNILMDNKKHATRQAVYSAAPLYIRQSDAEICRKKAGV